MAEMQKMSGEINFNNLTYYFKSSNLVPINFIGFRGPLNIFEETIKQSEVDQKKFKSNSNEITPRNLKHREKYQSDVIKNSKNLSNSRQKFIYLFNDYAKIRSEAMFKTNR